MQQPEISIHPLIGRLQKRSCLKYIFGLLLLFTTYRMPFTTYRMPLKVIVLRIPRFRNNFL